MCDISHIKSDWVCINKIPVMYGIQYLSTVAEQVEYKVNLIHDKIKFSLLRCNVFHIIKM